MTWQMMLGVYAIGGAVTVTIFTVLDLFVPLKGRTNRVHFTPADLVVMFLLWWLFWGITLYYILKIGREIGGGQDV